MSFISNCALSRALPEFAFLAAFLGFVAYAAFSDVRGFRIPNVISLALILLFFLRLVFVSPGIDLRAHLLVATAAFLILFLFYMFGWFGAGDAKLITAIMLWAGPGAGLQFLAALSIAGAIFALLLLTLGKALRAYAPLSAYVPLPRSALGGARRLPLRRSHPCSCDFYLASASRKRGLQDGSAAHAGFNFPF